MTFSQSWLENQGAIRGVLVEAFVSISGAADTPVYLSNIGFMTSDSNISFNPVIANNVAISESISVDGQVSMSFGDIELHNPIGDLDIWLDSTYVWVNKPIKVYVGDPNWTVSNLAALQGGTIFKKVFDGVIEDIDSRSRTSLNIKVRDKLERLNNPITETVLGTTGTWSAGQTNKEAIVPLVFGEVFNFEPLLEDPALLRYRINQGAAELLIEVRDNGAPLYTHNGSSITRNSNPVMAVDLTTSRIALTHPLAGTITISMQGVKNSINLTTGALVTGTYANNIANLIALIVTQYGSSESGVRFAAGDLDLPNLAAFQTANPQPVGIVITDKANTLEVCQQLARSIGAQVHMSPEGKLGLVRLGVPTTIGVTFTDPITDADILHHTLEVTMRVPVIAATTIEYNRNYTTQDDLLTLIPTEHKKLFADETTDPAKIVDTSVKSTYKLSDTTEPQESLLIVKSDATAEATRRNNYFKVPRTVYKFTGTSKLLSLVLGQSITVIHSRFNLYNAGAGRVGQVISLNSNWAKSTVDVEVII